MLGLFKYGVATLYNASENVCIIADRHDLHIPKIFPCHVKVFVDETDDTKELQSRTHT